MLLTYFFILKKLIYCTSPSSFLILPNYNMELLKNFSSNSSY